MPKCIVIGGGFGGMAAALRMRKKGYDVTLIDKQDKLGGRGYQYDKQTEHGTFVHDAGPTVITAKFLFDELFELFGKRREDYVEFRDIYPWYRIQFADGSVFNYGGTLEQFENEIRKFGGERDVEGFRKYLAHSKKIFDKGFTELGDQPFHSFTTMLKCAPALMRLGNYRTVWQMGKKYIKDEKLRRVFSFQPLLVGGNPFNTTSIYSLIFYLEREWGVQFAMGGTGAIVRALRELMEEEGINVVLGTGVAKLHAGRELPIGAYQQLEGGPDLSMLPDGTTATVQFNRTRVFGVERDDSVYESTVEDVNDIIVCNADPPHVYRNLIDAKHRPKWKDKKIDALQYSMGLFVLYFGTTRQYPDVAHHTIVLGETYKELLTKLFDEKELEREDLSVYLHRPTATDPSMAPEGMDSFYVLVPVPNLQPRSTRGTTVRECDRGAMSGSGSNDAGPDIGSADRTPSRSCLASGAPLTAEGAIDWDAFGDTFKQDVIHYLERTVLPGLSDCITGDFFVTPNHFRDNLNTHHGTGFSVQPIFRQSAWFRFHNKSEDIDGLYFVGAGTHPGAGMPGVLCSAKVLDRLIPPVEGSAKITP